MNSIAMLLRPVARRRIWRLFAAVGLLPLLGGCVERIMKIRTEPEQALVTINDEEVGVSPVSFSFTWYGDYDIIVRKPGYETLKTHYRVDAPWWQYPPVDFVAEVLVPTMIRDERELPTFALTPTSQPTVKEMVERSVQMREQTSLEVR